MSWTTKDKRWVAHINAGGQQRNLGHFKDEITAAKVYDDAAREAFGEWAMLNFPTEAERAFADQWYDLDDACAFFGVGRSVWKRWYRERRVRGGRLVPSQRGGKRRVYTREELEQFREDMFGEDKLYKDGKTGVYHVPEGWLTRHEACSRFGVSIMTWWRWEKLGWITCGERLPGGPRVYRVEDIERLVAEHGMLSPPYSDPDRPGVYRVPLSGRMMTRREALIDADALPLIEEGSCHLAGTSEGIDFVSFWINGEHVPLRRLIMGVSDSNLNVGHKNGDPLDCRRENLHVKTTLQRVRGKCKCAHVNGTPTSSQYKGVYWETYTGKWRAVIRALGKNHSLGRFHNEVDAAEAYDIAARRFFGKHAWLNFPREDEQGRRDDVPLRAAA